MIGKYILKFNFLLQKKFEHTLNEEKKYGINFATPNRV